MTTEAITPLRQRMIEDMNARKLCAGTQRGHIRSCKRFAAFLKRSPETATFEDIRQFQLHLAEIGAPVATQHSLPSGRYSLTWTGLSPAGSHQLLRLAHLFDHLVGPQQE